MINTTTRKCPEPIAAPLAAVCLAVLALASCSGGGKDAGAEGVGAAAGDPASSATVLDASLIADAPPGGEVLGVVEARAAAKPGDAITLRGKVGGRAEPFVEGRALLVLADENAIASCDENPDDSCETPWDYCCETAEAIKASTATIQVLDSEEKVAKAGLKGFHGIRELSVLVVKGTVDAASGEDLLVVNAESIHVEKP